jgi:osmotically-inducible protein OsmY
MKHVGFRVTAAAALTLFCLAGSPLTPHLRAQSSTSQCAPDNSANNKNQGKTADNAGNATTDRMTTAQIRKAIMADKDLSLYAHNVKIIVRNGNVTLKGPVKSDDERNKVQADASNVVSADKISNQLTVSQ